MSKRNRNQNHQRKKRIKMKRITLKPLTDKQLRQLYHLSQRMKPPTKAEYMKVLRGETNE